MAWFIDIEKLIAEIEVRPCLWDTRCHDYANRAKKAKTWRDVATAVVPDFAAFEEPVKKQMEQKILKKWKGVRSSFSRELHKQRTDPPGSAATRKIYTYFSVLQFLLPVTESKSTVSNFDAQEEYEEEEEEEDYDDKGLVQLIQSTEESDTCVNRGPKEATRMAMSSNETKNTEEEHLSHFHWNRSLEKRDRWDAERQDEDKQFFLSLLPEIRYVHPDLKLDCKMEIMSVIKKYRTRSRGSMPYLSPSPDLSGTESSSQFLSDGPSGHPWHAPQSPPEVQRSYQNKRHCS